MEARPPIEAVGEIVDVHEPGRLYRVEMPNGYRAYAIIERKGPRIPDGINPLAQSVRVQFSPYDMSKCRIVAWLIEETKH